MHAQIGVSAVTFTSSSTGGTSSATAGYQFTLSSPQSVTALSYFDEGANGLNGSHPVGLWDESGSLLAQVTVTPASPMQDSFRYVAVPPLTLLPGQVYTVGGLFTQSPYDPYAFFATGVRTAPGLTLGNAALTFGSALTKPAAGSSGNGGFFAGSLIVQPLPQPAIPEPNATVFFTVGAIALLAARLPRPRFRHA